MNNSWRPGKEDSHGTAPSAFLAMQTTNVDDRPLKKRRLIPVAVQAEETSKKVSGMIEDSEMRKVSDTKRKANGVGNALAWYPKVTLPRSLKILRIDRLAKIITQSDFQSFQDHLIFLGIIERPKAPPEQSRKAKNLSNIPLQFYAQLKGRFQSFAFLHLLTISFLNGRLAFGFLEQFPFFKQVRNNSQLEIKLGEERKSTEITITRNYTLRNVKISKVLRKIFVNSRKFWIDGKRKPGESLLCNLKFNEEVNEAREIFVVSCIRAGVSKELIAKFCVSQFLGTPMNSWEDIFAHKGSIGLTDPEADDQQPWLWSMDPREYVFRTWRFLSGAPTEKENPAMLRKFLKDIQDKHPGALFVVNDTFCGDFESMTPTEHPKVIEQFGNYRDRWKRVTAFSRKNIYAVFKFLFSGRGSTTYSFVAENKNGKRVLINSTIVLSTPRRYIAEVYTKVTNEQSIEEVKFSEKVFPPSKDYLSYVFETVRLLCGYPTSDPDPSSMAKFLSDLKASYGEENGDRIYLICDYHTHYSNARVYESSLATERYGSWDGRWNRMHGSFTSLSNLFSIAKRMFRNQAVMFRHKMLTTAGQADSCETHVVKSRCGRYYGAVSSVVGTDVVDEPESRPSNWNIFSS